MSHDFILVRLAQPPAHFPAELPNDFGEKDTVKFNDVAPLAQTLASKLGLKRNGPPVLGRQSYWWKTNDGGSLDVGLDEAAIHVDTHAHWRFVLEMFEYLNETYPDLAILDPQTMHLHNNESYYGILKSGTPFNPNFMAARLDIQDGI